MILKQKYEVEWQREKFRIDKNVSCECWGQQLSLPTQKVKVMLKQFFFFFQSSN